MKKYLFSIWNNQKLDKLNSFVIKCTEEQRIMINYLLEWLFIEDVINEDIGCNWRPFEEIDEDFREIFSLLPTLDLSKIEEE